jgi:hypothetical protein
MSNTAPAPANRNILFISYHFPPSAAVGGQRIVNFANAMQALSWHPEVLTIADDDVESLDRARLKDVEGITIHKAGVLPTAIALLGSLKSRMARRRTAPSPGTSGAALRNAATATAMPRAGSHGWRRFVLSLLVLPDWERGWCLPATLHAFRTIKRRQIGWFMTSCPPYSVHLVGVAVKLLTGKRWVADFRDPWMTTGSKRLYPTSPLSMAVERWLEKQVVRHADLVVFNVQRLRNAYAERYSDVPASKFVFIPNGLSKRGPSAPAAKYDVFTISYTGSLYVGRSPEPVLQAVAQLIRDGRVPADAIKVRLVGQCGQIDGVATEAVVERHGLTPVVDVSAPVPYEQAFEIVRRSHLALLLAPNLPYQVPAKVYDYLAAGTRILAIAEEGGTADVVQETASGRAFRPDQVSAIADFIAAEFATRDSGAAASTALARYDVARITQELVAQISRVEAAAAAARTP